jgi:hypothetical protein
VRIPRSGGMIASMFLALFMIALLPVVFLGALAQSADSHPRPLKEVVAELAQPLVKQFHRLTR